MAIRFDVTRDPDNGGDRALRIEGQLVGWIERGRDMVGSRGRFTEWGFVPADPRIPQSPARHSISEAYDDAREYAHNRGFAGAQL